MRNFCHYATHRSVIWLFHRLVEFGNPQTSDHGFLLLSIANRTSIVLNLDFLALCFFFLLCHFFIQKRITKLEGRRFSLFNFVFRLPSSVITKVLQPVCHANALLQSGPSFSPNRQKLHAPHYADCLNPVLWFGYYERQVLAKRHEPPHPQ